LEKLFPFIKVTTLDLRSSLGKNAIQCIGNLLIKIDNSIIYKYIDECVALLCQLCGSDKKFLCSIASQTLSSAIELGPTKWILSSLFESTDNKNAKIASQACISLEQCLQQLKIGQFEQEQENRCEEIFEQSTIQNQDEEKLSGIDFTKLICSLNNGLKGKLASGKNAASNSLFLLYKEYGDVWFEEIIKKTLSEFEAVELIRNINQKTQKKPVRKRVSIQQLHQDNQQSDIKLNEISSNPATQIKETSTSEA